MKNILSLLTLLFVSSVVFAQNNVGIGTNNPRNSAILDLYSEDQGLLLPRVDTLSFMSLGALDHGLMVYDTTISKILIWNGTNWESVSGDNSLQSAYDGGQTINMSSGNIDFISSSANSVLFIDGANERLGIGTSTPSAGFKLDVVGGDIQVNGLRMGRGTGGILNNLAIGLNALNNNPTGGLNLAIGNTALQQTSTGSSNLAIGTGALIFNTTGSSNTIIGHDAMRAPAGSDQNTGIGEGIMRNGPTGNANTAIGYYSLRNKTGNSNSALGHNTGITLTAGDNNTFLGANADAGVATLTNATAIGANATVSADNTLVLGDNNVFVGIGTSSPNARLQINSALSATALRLTNDATGTATTDGLLFSTNSAGIANIRNRENANMFIGTNNLIGQLVLAPTGNVGIGTSSPANKLEVIGDAAKFDSVIIANNAQAGYVLTAADATGAASWQAPATSPWSLNATDVFYTGGNVGIGTDAPNAPLQFANTLAPRKIVLFEATNNDHQYFGFGVTGSELRYQINSPASHVFYASSSATTSTELMRISSNGNVGIGTSTPQGRLHVANSDWNAGSMLVSTPAGTVGSAIRFTNGDVGNRTYDIIGSTGLSAGAGVGSFAIYDNTLSAYRLTINPNGNVGIGTSAPAFKLDVSGTARVTGEAEINGTQFLNTASTAPVIDNQFRVGLGAMANVIFYTACACPTVAAVLHIDFNGIVKVMSQAGHSANSLSGSGTNTITISDCCGQNVPLVFSVAGGIATISYPTGIFTTAKWVITPM